MVSDLFPPVDGGVPTVIYELSKRLVARGRKVVVATYKFEPNWPNCEIIDGIEVFRTPLKWNRSVPFYLSAPLNMKSLVNSLWQKFGGFDVLHLHLSLAGVGALMTPRAKKTPKVFTFHGDWAKEYLTEAGGWKKKLGLTKIEAALMCLMQKRCLRNVDTVVVLSKYSQGQVKGLISQTPEIPHPPADGPQPTIIPRGVDLEKFRPNLPSPPNLPKGRFLVLTIRRLYKRMGLENLIDAIDIVRKEYPEVFLIIGGRGYLFENLKLKIACPPKPRSPTLHSFGDGARRRENLRLTNNVRLEGFIPEEEKANYLAAADLYVLPSISQEGFGLTTLEALACGTPVLGTPTGGTPELLGGFRKDLLLKGTSAADIAEGIIDFIKNHRGDEGLRQQCREYAEKFSWERMVGEYEELYEKLKFQISNFKSKS